MAIGYLSTSTSFDKARTPNASATCMKVEIVRSDQEKVNWIRTRNEPLLDEDVLR